MLLAVIVDGWNKARALKERLRVRGAREIRIEQVSSGYRVEWRIG